MGIDGEWVDTEWVDTEETCISITPATGEQSGEFSKGTKADVDRAIAVAAEAADEWRALSYPDRAEYLWDVYAELKVRTEALGELVTRECGIPDSVCTIQFLYQRHQISAAEMGDCLIQYSLREEVVWGH